MITDNTPKLREFQPINFLYFRTETKVTELINFLPVAKDLFKEAVRLNLHVSGLCIGTTLVLRVMNLKYLR